MEINSDNAFYLIFTVTYGIFIPYFDNVFNKVAEIGHSATKWLLKRPLVSTMISASVFVTISGVVTFSLIAVFGVICIVSSIILFEGFIFAGVFLIVISVMSIVIALAITFYIVRSSYSDNHSDDEYYDFDVFL